MPNYVGTTIMAAAYGLRSVLGQDLDVQAPGGAASQYLPVARQSPAPGTVITAASTIMFWPDSTTSSSSSASSGSSTSSSNPGGPLSSGTYAVGTDISAGTWHTDGGTRCYYERDRDTNGTIGSIIANDNFTGPTTITVTAKDAVVEFSGDCTWTRR